MRVQMVVGLFKYEPCELRVQDGVLYLHIANEERSIAEHGLSGAAITRRKNGSCHLEFMTEGERFEFVLAGEQAGDEAQSLLYQLTKNREHLEMRMRSE